MVPLSLLSAAALAVHRSLPLTARIPLRPLKTRLLYYCTMTTQYLPVSSAKDLVRKSWDMTSNADMSEFLGWVMSTLRIRSQRVSADQGHSNTKSETFSGQRLCCRETIRHPES